jgi:carbonic anhydrase
VINEVASIGQLAQAMTPSDGPLFEDAVIHHNQCGTAFLSDEDFRHSYAQRIETNAPSLSEHPVLDPGATVTRDLARLRM